MHEFPFPDHAPDNGRARLLNDRFRQLMAQSAAFRAPFANRWQETPALRYQPAKNSLTTGAIADASTICPWPSSVRRSAFGTLEAIAFAARSKKSDASPPIPPGESTAMPPIITSVGCSIVLKRSAGTVPPDIQAAS